MIEYVIAENPDDRILSRASEFLKDGQLVCFPTDTNWIVVCDPFSKGGTERLYRLKGEDRGKHFSLLCDGISMASEWAVIHDSSYRLIRTRVPGHYTFIFEAQKKITKALKASKADREVGLRIPPVTHVLKLLEVHGGALLSTNLTNEMVNVDLEQELYSFQIEESLGSAIALIIDPGEYEFVGSSTIIDFSQGDAPVLIREGAGKVFF
jgi:tRNA threonylcarbamoyl adenosine modification protein (Sua5/YciO/YrdC/YwlC family)